MAQAHDKVKLEVRVLPVYYLKYNAIDCSTLHKRNHMQISTLQVTTTLRPTFNLKYQCQILSSDNLYTEVREGMDGGLDNIC